MMIILRKHAADKQTSMISLSYSKIVWLILINSYSIFYLKMHDAKLWINSWLIKK